jgi:hypothetical protein
MFIIFAIKQGMSTVEVKGSTKQQNREAIYKMWRVTFEKPQNYPKLGDYVAKVYPYTVIDKKLVGTPEEKNAYISKSILIKLTGPLQAAWESGLGRKMTPEEIEKVMFVYAREDILAHLKDGLMPPDKEHRLEASCAIPDVLPFDPAEIQTPTGAILEINQK